jgi:hypothetical protein
MFSSGIEAAFKEPTGFRLVISCTGATLWERSRPSDDKSNATGRELDTPGPACFEIAAPFADIEVDMTRDHPASRALREANKAFKPVETKKPMTDYAKAQQSHHENRERLKAERLAREAEQGNRRR